MNFNIAVFPGDGVGPEIMSEGIKVLEKITEIDPKNGKRHITLSKHYAIQGEEKKRYNELEKAFYNKHLSIEEKLIILYQELSDLEQKKEHKDSIRFHQRKENALKLCSVLTIIHNTNSQSHAIY